MRRLLCTLLFAAALASSSFAQSQPRYTWLRFYTATPGTDFVRTVRDGAKPRLDTMLAAHTIAGWGVAAPFTRDQETWTHVVYVALPDWKSADAVVSVLNGIQGEKVHDVILHHLVQSTTPPSAAPKYIGYDTYVIKPGRDGDAVGLFKEWAPAVMGSLPNVVLWGLSSQELATSEPWTHMAWYFMSDLAALDDMNTATMSLPPQKLQGFDVRLRDMSEPEKHRSQVLRIVTP